MAQGVSGVGGRGGVVWVGQVVCAGAERSECVLGGRRSVHLRRPLGGWPMWLRIVGRFDSGLKR